LSQNAAVCVNLLSHCLEKGQTLISEDLSSVAPFDIKMLNLWNDFRKVVKFIDENRTWLIPLLESIVINKKAESETDCH